MFDQRYRDLLKQKMNSGLYRSPIEISDKQGPFFVSNGNKILNFASNDYLGLASDKRVKAVVARNFELYGPSSSSSRLVTGNHGIIREAEHTFADYFGYEDALFLPSGFQANLALLSTLFNKGDHLFFDKRIHASSVKGIQLSGAEFSGYKHNSLSHLEKRLISAKEGPKALITESLFSMDGDSPDFSPLKDLKERFGFMAVVDEAHAFGVLGQNGRGLSHGFADVAVGTLGKAFGLFGAFILLPRLYRDYIMNFASPLIYTTSLPEAQAKSAAEILDLVSCADDKRYHIMNLRNKLAGMLKDDGFKIKGNAHIIAIETGDEQKSLALSRRLLDKHIFVFPARYPTVPLGRSILRITLTAMHTDEHIQQLARELRSCCI